MGRTVFPGSLVTKVDRGAEYLSRCQRRDLLQEWNSFYQRMVPRVMNSVFTSVTLEALWVSIVRSHHPIILGTVGKLGKLNTQGGREASGHQDIEDFIAPSSHGKS